MSDPIKRIATLKETVAKQQRLVDQSTGAIETLLNQLQEIFNVETLEEAEQLEEELKQRIQLLQTKLDKKLTAFEEKWSDVLDEL